MALALFSPVPVLAHSEADAAEQSLRSPLRAVRASDAIVLDGRLDEGTWAETVPATGFLQRDPHEGEAATDRTEVRVAYDDEALYVGARMFDPDPGRIVRRLSRRDSTTNADHIAIYLDPRHDHRTGVVFELSAAGVQSDSVLFNDSWEDDSWDAVWESAVAVDLEGWVAEMRIPLSQLRFGPGDRQVWGFNMSRLVERRYESTWLQLVPKRESGRASRMAHLVGLDGIRPRRGLQWLPYAVARSAFVAPSAAGDPFNDGSASSVSVGLDVKYSLTTNMTLDATVNPDFGQVEVDPAVVNLSDFETYYDERRPFFVEGSEIFGNFGANGTNNVMGFNRSDPELFHSRRIGRRPQGEADGEFVSTPRATTILGAAKVTGKTGSGWSLGLIEAVTGREYGRTMTGGAMGSLPVEPLTNYFAVRAHRDFGRVGAGFLATSVVRDLGDPALAATLASTAHVGGVDGYAFLDRRSRWVLHGRLAGSYVAGSTLAIEGIQRSSARYYQRPDSRVARLDPAATHLSGWTGHVSLNRNSGSLLLNTAAWATSPGFESNDLGFNRRSDRLGAHVALTWRKVEPAGPTRRRSVTVAPWGTWNFDGDRQAAGLSAYANAQLRNYWNLGANVSKRWRVLDDRFTRGGPSAIGGAYFSAYGFVGSDARKRLSLTLRGAHVSTEFGSRSAEASAYLTLKPSHSLSLSFGPSVERSRPVAQWVGAIEDPVAAETYGSRYVYASFDQTELSLPTRINWILSPKMSLQVYAQPLLSSGRYTRLKELARPRSFEFNVYGEDVGEIAQVGADYVVDPDGAGPASAFAVGNPDFDVRSLRINAVFRWEWRLGSTLYFVWTQQREALAEDGALEVGRDMSKLIRAPSDDIFQVKITYRFAR